MENNHSCKITFEDVFKEVYLKEREKNKIKFQHLKYIKTVNRTTISRFILLQIILFIRNVVLFPLVVLAEIIEICLEPINNKILQIIKTPIFVFINFIFFKSFKQAYQRAFYSKENPKDPLWKEYELFYKS